MITRFCGPTGYGTLVALYEILFSLEFVLDLVCRLLPVISLLSGQLSR